MLVTLLPNGELFAGVHDFASPQRLIRILTNADGDGIGCRSEGTSEYSAASYSMLMDFLAYDRSPDWIHASVMRAKVQRFVDNTPYQSVKSVLKACAPQFREKYLDAQPLGSLDAQLTRSRVIIYDQRDKQQFTRVIVMLTGLP
ncbi:hypothetical protein [Bradyrhizobium sp. AT1]|uniref:hypothetical protein n=1 Tax=Bradyrhizobium sp. AT1 TaxID=574934 RepID=UPI0012EDC1DE|nr:hypothetical protein [Bradyrhizobium sp. AT1]